MAAKKGNPAMDFIVEQLKKNPNIAYADIKQAADSKRLKVFPIMFGRAQAMLGIVKSKPRGQGKAAIAKRGGPAAAESAAAPAKRGPGRPRKSAPTSFDSGSLESIIAAVKSSEQAKARYRDALEKIQQVLESALSS